MTLVKFRRIRGRTIGEDVESAVTDHFDPPVAADINPLRRCLD